MTIDDADTAAIEQIIGRQSAAWRAGDAAGFGADTTDGVLFTNIIGMFSVGRAAFDAQHAHIFATVYKGSVMAQQVVAMTPIHPDVVVVDTLTSVTGVSQTPPGIALIDGALRTRLEQVMIRAPGGWRVAAFHNVAVNPVVADSLAKSR